MKTELATIIGALISNIGCTNMTNASMEKNMYIRYVQANRTVEGINKLGELWPNLTQEEKQEIKAVIKAIETTYQDTTSTPNDYSMMMHR